MSHWDEKCIGEAMFLFDDLPDEMAEAYANAADGATLDDICDAARFDMHIHQHEHGPDSVGSPEKAIEVLQHIDERHHETDRTQYEETRTVNGVTLPDLLGTIEGMADSTLENVVRFHVCEIHELIMIHRNAEPMTPQRLSVIANSYEGGAS